MNYWENLSFKRIIVTVVLLMALIEIGACSWDVDYTPPAGSSAMAITHYSFGEMVIDGNTFEHDLAITTDKHVKNWSMLFTHHIQVDDVRNLVSDGTRTLIIGTGALNGCEVDDEVVDYMKSRGIELHILGTTDAVKRFNALPKEGLAACFHLNC